jgi:hypothetical protein
MTCGVPTARNSRQYPFSKLLLRSVSRHILIVASSCPYVMDFTSQCEGSCALGQMPLVIELGDARSSLLECVSRH